MDATTWATLTPAQRKAQCDLSGLTPDLIGLDGWRVEAVTTYGETRRFIVGRSTGWKPCHLEVFNRRSHGGPAAESSYRFIHKLYKVR